MISSSARPEGLIARAGLDHHPPLDLGVDDLAVDARLEVLEHQAVGLEHVRELARVLPPAAHRPRLDPRTVVDQVLDRVRDLQLAAPRWLDRAGRLEDLRAEQVDANEGHVRRRVLGLLDEAHDALAVELGDPVVPRVRHLGQEQ